MYGTHNQSSYRGGSNWMNEDDRDHARFSHGNANENRYSDDYAHPSNMGRGSMSSIHDEDRYSYNRENENRDREDEGFFERIGHGIKDAWNSIAGDDEDRDEYGNTRRSSSAGSPPYNYGSGSNNAGW